MRRVIGIAIAIVGLCGCSSANRIERGAMRHEQRAEKLQAEGKVQAASKERKAAEKQYSKANTRRGFENAMPIAFH